MKQHDLRWFSLCLRPCISLFLLPHTCAIKKHTSRQQSTSNVANLAQGTNSSECDHTQGFDGRLGFNPQRARRPLSFCNIRDWDPTHAGCDTSHHIVGDYPLKNNGSHIDASLSRQPLVKGERLVRAEMNAVIILSAPTANVSALHVCVCVLLLCGFSHSCCWRDRFAKRE